MQKPRKGIRMDKHFVVTQIGGPRVEVKRGSNHRRVLPHRSIIRFVQNELKMDPYTTVVSKLELICDKLNKAVQNGNIVRRFGSFIYPKYVQGNKQDTA